MTARTATHTPTASRRALFLDRDNTIIMNHAYITGPHEVRLMPGAPDLIAAANAAGWLVVIVSNQSAVAKGIITTLDVDAVNAEIDRLLAAATPPARIDLHLYCPFHPQGVVPQYTGESDLRKPAPGMLLEAARRLSLDLPRCLLIGDAFRDIDAAKAVGVPAILFMPPPEAGRSEHAPPASLAPAAPPAPADPPDPAYTHLPPGLPVLYQLIDAIPLFSAPMESGPTAVSPAPAASSRTDDLLLQLITEARRAREGPPPHFSPFKLMAGICQILVFAAMFLAYLFKDQSPSLVGAPSPAALLMLSGIILQGMTIAMILFSKK